MQIDIFTLFPTMFDGYLQESILKRAQEANLLALRFHNIRDYTHDKHHVTDDAPYGGGGGMVMKPEPIFAAVESILGLSPRPPNHPMAIPGEKRSGTTQPPIHPIPIILLSPTGRRFTQALARELAAYDRLALICGRYEGVDERVRQHLATDRRQWAAGQAVRQGRFGDDQGRLEPGVRLG